MTRVTAALVTALVVLSAGAAPAFAGGLGAPNARSGSVDAADRLAVLSGADGPRAEAQTTQPEPTDSGSGSNTSDATGPPPETKVAAGLLDGRDEAGSESGSGATSDGPATDSSVEMVDVVVEAAPGSGDAVARRVRGNAGTVALRHGRLVQASLPRTALTAVADSPAVERIRRPNRPVPQSVDQGSVVSEGLSNMNVSAAYSAGQYGDNVTVAVVDVDPGFNASNPEIADNVVDTYDANPNEAFDTKDGAHGTAVAELVVDTAPNASLVLIEISTATELYSAMDYIRENTSADVAVMSLSWYNVGPMNGSGHFNDQFRQSAANGTLWSVSAGNTANGEHWNGTWRDGDGDAWLNFSESRELMTVSGDGSVYLQWDDWPTSDQNLDLYLYNNTSSYPDNPLYVADNVQDGTWEPTEALRTSDSTDYVAIKRKSGTEPLNLTIFSSGASLSPYTSAQSITNPTTDAVLTVGAVDYYNNEVESFSSRGPTLDGRSKPDIVAPDNVSTDVYDRFRGTSASAPHAGGVVALALDKNESLTPKDAISLLESTANESAVDGTEPNNDAGYGLVDAGVAVASTDPEPVAPVLSNATAVDETNGDGTVGSDDAVRVNVTATDAGIGIANVTANASAFGAGVVNLTDPDGDDVYNATFSVNASAAAPNGTYAIPIEAYDRAGNNNTTKTNDLTLAIDRTEPSIMDANAVDLDDGDGNVTALDRILLNATATDADSGIANVTANASGFGAGVVNLTDPDGDDVYNATITVDADEAAPNGSYSVPVTAKDAAGNENTTTTNALQLNVSDRVAPNVTNFSVRVVDTRTLNTSFDSNETLSTVNLTVTDLATDTRVRTLSLADFGTVGGSYSNQTVLDSAGRYRIDLVTAADASGNDGSGDANATVKLITRTVTVAHRDGPAPDMANVTANVYLTQDSSGLLQIQLRDAAGAEFSDRTDLSDLGVEPNTTLAVNVTVKNWTPRLLLGAARNATWNVTAVDADTTTINVTADPADVQYNETQLNGTTRNWSETDTADFGSNATVDLAVSDLSGFDAARRDRFDGTMLLTDAQAFGTPRYNTSTDALSLYVAAPHLNESGGQNRGFFDAFLPTAVLNDWGVSDPASIDVSALGTAATPAETATTSEGVRLEIPIHYSAGDVELAPDSTAPSITSPSITDATDGDGTVADGDRIRVSATVTDATSGVASVSADASPFGAGTVWLSDSDTDGDDVYTGSFTVDGGAIGSDGSYSVSVSATDVAGNTGSKSTNALRFDSADGGGGDSGSGGDGGGGGGDGGGGNSGGGAPLPPQTATPTPTPTPIPTPEPRVRVARTADGASVTIERASAGRTVAAELGDATTSSIAGVTGLRVKPSVDVTNFSVSLTPPTRTTADAPALPGGSAVGYFRADAVGLPNDRIASASLRFTVPESSLPAGATPDRVRLYRYHDGEWQRLETTYLGDGVYEASTPGFSVFAIGADEASDGGGTGRSGSVATGDGTDGAGDDGGGSTGGSGATAAASTATTESGGASPGPGTSGGSTPGFGAAVAVLAILLTAGGAARWTGESRT